MAHNRYSFIDHFQGGGIKFIPNEVNGNIKRCERESYGHWVKYLLINGLDIMEGEVYLLW